MGIASLLMAGTGVAEQSSIQGKVIRAEGVGVGGVEVKLARMKGEKADSTFKEQATKTDGKGGFTFANLEAGSYTLTVAAKFARESELPCRPSGLLALNRNKWFVAVARTADGGIVEIVTSDPLPIEVGKTRNETIDLRCK